MKDIKKIAGQNIKRYRIKKGLTQLELAQKTGITYKYLQRIEGKNPPNLKIETVQKLANKLQIPITKFLT